MAHAMAYDSARMVTVLFGGYSNLYSFDDTWEWNGVTWTSRTSTQRPSARDMHAMAYDANRQRVVLFGGYGATGYLNDTWEWDGLAWTPMGSVNKPAARIGHTMAYDSVRQRVVLFGGQEQAMSRSLNDTWEWNGVEWTPLVTVSSPPARYGHAMAFDSVRQRLVVFGGYDAGSSLSGMFNDTWELSSNGNTWGKYAPTTQPSARRYSAMAYDSARQRVVMVGGSPGAGMELNETWEWNGSNWTFRTPPGTFLAVASGAMVYDSGRKVSVHFGGMWTVHPVPPIPPVPQTAYYLDTMEYGP